MSFLFVGEKRSPKAISMQVRWENGRLAACTLFKALVSCGMCPEAHRFCNLWHDDGELDPNTIRFAKGAQPLVVALGSKVSRKLNELGIQHRKLIHPAARGSIRLTKTYFAHVRSVLKENQ